MRVGNILALVASGTAAVLCAAPQGRAAPPLPPVHSAFGDTDGQEVVRVSLKSESAPLKRTKRIFTSSGCSDDMVRVAGRFCIDRYESSMIDDASERPLSPYYPPTSSLLRAVYDEWSQRLLDGSAGVDVA